jgi:hypothetical protein
MGKALMVGTVSTASNIGSGEEFNLFGFSSTSGTEANTQASCTEAASFTALAARVIGGNSGVATFAFRDAGAAGQNTVDVTGVSAAEDTTHTDSLAAGDLFNIAYTDTGTASNLAWVKCNIEMASGHGNIHCASNFATVICDAASSTRWFGLAGNIAADGGNIEANEQWKNRGYTSWEALQVRVTANARTNDSTFTNRINGSNGTALVTYAASATGLVEDTAVGDAIADGDLLNTAITLGTGVEDMSVSFVGGTFKSTSTKSEIYTHAAGTVTRTASATAHYVPIGGLLSAPSTTYTDATARIKPGFAGVAGNLRCYLSANTYASDGTLKLYQNGSAVITLTLGAGGGAAWYENTSDSVSFDADDEFSLEFDEGGASGSITIRTAGLTFAPAAVAANYPQKQMLIGVGT